MSCLISGKDIEANSIVYYRSYYWSSSSGYQSYTRRALKLEFDDTVVVALNFIYDPNDKLYATPAIRYKWKRKPYKHPYSTLFDLLQQELKTQET